MTEATSTLTRAGIVWAVQGGVLALTLWLGLGMPSRLLLNALLPAQAMVYRALMPEHRLLRFELRQHSTQLSLAVRSQTTRYILVRGKAYPPGVDFEAGTPARSALVIAMMVVLGGVLVIRWRADGWLCRAVFGLAAAGALAVIVPAVVLAGAQWGLAYVAMEELSAPALLVAASDFLLHGGGLALAAAVVWGMHAREPLNPI